MMGVRGDDEGGTEREHSWTNCLFLIFAKPMVRHFLCEHMDRLSSLSPDPLKFLIWPELRDRAPGSADKWWSNPDFPVLFPDKI